MCGLARRISDAQVAAREWPNKPASKIAPNMNAAGTMNRVENRRGSAENMTINGNSTAKVSTKPIRHRWLASLRTSASTSKHAGNSAMIQRPLTMLHIKTDGDVMSDTTPVYGIVVL